MPLQPHPHGTDIVMEKEHTATNDLWDDARSQEIEHDYVDALKKVRSAASWPQAERS